jgi:hypothetical protein
LPYYEYQCGEGHVTERLFKTFQAAEGIDWVVCATCAGTADRVLSVPFPAHFHGNPDGFYKPSPQKRFSYSKMTERGNADTYNPK